MSNIFVKQEEFDATINTLIAHHSQNEIFHYPQVRPQSQSSTSKWEKLTYVCAKCGMEFGHESYYDQHLENLHKELQTTKELNMLILSGSQAECLICGAQVTHRTVRDLQLHHFQHLQHKPFKCKCHGYHFHDRADAMVHLAYSCKQLDEELLVVCKVEDKVDAQYDPEYPETGIGYNCSECDTNLPTEDAWKQHCHEVHDFKTLEGLNMTRLESGSVRCNECSAIIAGKWDNYKLRRHKFTHSPYKAFYCLVCKYPRKRKDDVLQHIRRMHAPRGKKYY